MLDIKKIYEPYLEKTLWNKTEIQIFCPFHSHNHDTPSLRVTTKSENRFNSRLSRNNTHGDKGVTYNKENKGWVAHIKKDGKTYYTSCVKTKLEAIELRKEMEVKYYGYNP